MRDAHTFQRVVGYITDVFIITILAVLLTSWIPKSETYKEAIKREETLISDYTNKEINESEYIDELYKVRYTIEKENIVEALITVVLSVGYFTAFAYYNKGQTLGKKMLHIRVVTTKGKEASYLQLFARTLIHNGVFTSILSIVLLMIIKSNQYAYTVGLLSILQSVIMITSFILVVCRKDKRGLHDLICRTKVIEY